ncbi:hypothetical protein BC332_12183 [Capsicum chinense]|nr:hypothetical protein BC332_12183 [Capsicum chinense]
MAQHANRSCSVRENQSKNLLTDEVPSFSLGLTQDEVFNLGSTNVFSKEGVTIEELRSKHRNDSEKIVEIMKRKRLTKISSPTKFQKSVKRKKLDEKGECSKIASPVASDSESEQEKVEEVIRDQIFMARVLPKFSPHIGCHTVNDIEDRIKTMLTKSQYKMFCTKSIFGFFMKKKDCVVQAQLGRCIMSLETRESSTSVIVIRAKGTILHFTIREFALVTGLNCATNKDEFVFDEEHPNRIIYQYFDGESFVQKKDLYAVVFDKIWGNDNDEDTLKFANLYFIHAFLLSSVDTVAISRLHYDLVESGLYSDYPWGSIAFEELARSLHEKLKPKGKLYMLIGMPLAIQIWLYECCSNVPRNVASKVDSQIPRILNWKTNSPRPRYETLMGSMFDDTDDKVVFKNIEPTRKEISAFHIPKKLVPGSASHNEDDSASPIKKQMKPHPKGVDELISKRSPPPRAAKMPFVWQEFNDVRGLISSSEFNQPPADENVKSTSPHQATIKFVREFNMNPEVTLVAKEMSEYQSSSMNDVYNEIDGCNEDNDIVLITKSVDESIGEAQISESQLTFPDDVLRSIDLDSITKANVEVEDEFKKKEGVIEMNISTPAEHKSKVNDVNSSKLDRQYKSAVHIPAGVNIESNADQHLSDSQNTLPDELLPSLNAYVNFELSIIVHPLANQAQQTPMHVSRIRRPFRYNESPFTMKFGSADG